MKHLFYQILVFGILSVGFTQGLQATHIMGVDITYECIGPCTYRIYFKEYFDCMGSFMSGFLPVSTSNPPGPPSLNISGLGACNPPIAGAWVSVGYTEVTPICPSLLNNPAGTHPTGCEGQTANPNPFVNGVVEASYYIDYDFCNTNCNQYQIVFSDCCRNSTIDSGAADDGIYTGQTIIDLSVSPCNSSPAFNNEPVPYICGGQPFTFNQGATDPDGDSLVYELGPCFSGNGIQVGYDPGYSPTQPLGPTWNVSINSQTGDITMTPNPSGSEVVAVMCVTVKEYRNGVLIGQVTRDMQITVISQCASTNPVAQGITNVRIGTDSVPANALSFNEVRVCPDVPICFDIPVVSQDTALDYTISWNQAISGATFTDANDPTVANSITGDAPTAQFCWTAPPTAEGAYFFVVTIVDDACPVPAFTQYTIIIYVQNTLINSYSQGIPIGCNEVELSVVPVSSIPSIYNNVFPITTWDGNGNLNLNPNLNDSVLTHLYPAPATYFYNMYLEDTFGCKIDLPGLVDLNSGVYSNAGPDVTICANYTFSLGTPALPGLTYTWSPSMALSDSTLAEPIFTFPGDTNQNVFNYVLEVTDGICTTYDYTTVIVNPTLEATVTVSDSIICAGQTSTLTAIGNLNAGYTYLWSTGDTTASITVTPNTTTTYSVLTFNNGCSSDPVFATIHVQSGPQAQVSGVLEVCPGEPTTLSATAPGAVSYVWQPSGFTGQTITLPIITGPSVVSVIAYDNEGCPGPTTDVNLSPFPNPVPLFGANTVCEGVSTPFQNLSSVPVGNIISYEWDFGDGSPSTTDPIPNHTFQTSGMYNVQLIATTDHGCTDSITTTINVEASPIADFTFTNVCEEDANSFTNTSSIASGNFITDYRWDFGDQSGEIFGQNQTHVYDTFGFYNVTLSVTSAVGCTDDYTQTVLVHPNPVADFDVISACEDSVVLTTSASVIAGSLDFIDTYEWDFGDDPSDPNNTSTRLNPTHVYPLASDYLIIHKVTTVNGCSDEVQRVVTVFPSPIASFTYDQTCENEQTRFFDNSSSDPATPIRGWFWDLDVPGVISDGQNATFEFDNSGSGTYRIAHGVITSEGCVDTVYQDVVINPKPNPGFDIATVCLYDSSILVNTSEIVSGSIVDWQVDFGDGSTAAFPTAGHIYNEPGEYTIRLTATSDSGCVNFVDRITMVAELPEISLIQGDSTCFGNQASLLVATDPDVEISWYYSMDENERPFHRGYSYVTPPLPYEATFYVQPTQISGLKCTNSRLPVTATVYEDVDLQLLVNETVLEMPLAVAEFSTASSVSIDSWSWSFGDGNTSTVSTPVHEYEYPGMYEINLTTVDINGCERELSTAVEVKLITGVSLPTAFSPNGDGINDKFHIGNYNVRDFQIKIFNRWGQKVYESDNPDFEWDGFTLKGNLIREGVYIYVVQATDLNGNQINESQSLTVIK